MDKRYLVYKITCANNNKIYIGQTYNSIENRLNEHFSKARNGVDTKFYRAIRKHGEGNFYIEILEEVSSQEELDDREFYWILHFDTVKKGYNSKNSKGKCGGDTLSNHPDIESISQKIRVSKLGDNNPMRKNGGLKGEKNGMYGKHLTDEHKRKISISSTGRLVSEETRKKMSEASKGKPKSKAQVEKHKEAMLGEDYYREVVLIDEDNQIIDKFKNRSEYYKMFPDKYSCSKSFAEKWIKKLDVYKNPAKLKRMKHLENKRLAYLDEFLQEKV